VRRLFPGLLVVAAAVGAHALTAYVPGLSRFFDFFLVVAVYYALTSNQVSGMLTGAACGLVQDALFAPILGLNAFSKALLGYLIGSLGTRIVLQQTFPRLMILAVATSLQAVIFFALHLVLGLPAEFPAVQELLLRMLGNAVLGGAAYGILRRRAERMV
jgi:rod shape-determining protein MreD